MPASVLPITERVGALVEKLSRRRLDLSRPEILDQGQITVVRLNERFQLPPDVGAYCNTRSSVGRVDVQTRVLTDATPRYDKISRGYAGEVFLEVISKSFDVELAAGISLTQAIFYADRRILDARELRMLAERERLLLDREGAAVPVGDRFVDDGGMILTVDLDQDPVGWVARRTSQVLRLAGGAANEAEEFFEPIRRPRDGRLWLRRDHFYILSTREFLRVPADFAVEMLPYDTSAGEFRAHYAGFFDPGFGWSPGGAGRGTPAVLEVRPHDDDLILRHGQPICKMAFESLAGRPRRPYGDGKSGSHYQDQRGPRLSRFVR
jgi:dCTP deaminase